MAWILTAMKTIAEKTPPMTEKVQMVKKKCNMKWQNHFHICKWILFAISSFTIIEKLVSEL